jgi:hypothetical protein
VTRPQHPILHGPLRVDLRIDTTPTPPQCFKLAFVNECPKTLPTVAILEKEGYPPPPDATGQTPPRDLEPELGIVSSDSGFLDSPDTEVIAGGVQEMGPDWFAIARQGHFLQWGFSGSPDEMTETGRRIFLNAVYYISTFRGAPILAFREETPRDDLVYSLMAVDGGSREDAEAELHFDFGNSIPGEAWLPREGRRAWFLSVRPFLFHYHDGGEGPGRFVIDQDARSLGIPNYDPRLLQRCVADLERGADAERARRLLARYTDEHFTQPVEWRHWLDENGKRLFFSDAAGYKFRVASASGSARSAPGPRRDDAAQAVGFETYSAGPREAGTISRMLKVKVAPGYHVYAPNTRHSAMTVLAIRLPKDSAFRFVEAPGIPTPAGGSISGHFTVPLKLRGTGKRVTVLVDYQACTAQFCLQPVAGREVSFDVRRR